MEKLDDYYNLDSPINLPSFEDISDYQLELINSSSCDENNNMDFCDDYEELKKEESKKPASENKKENEPTRKRKVLKYMDDSIKKSKIQKTNPILKKKNTEEMPKRTLRKRTDRKVN